MSRTFHHGDRAKERLFGWRKYQWTGHGGYLVPRRKQPRHQHDWHWLRNTPSWWVHDFMTVKQRAVVRDLTRRVEQGDLEQIWPLAKKPHYYYW